MSAATNHVDKAGGHFDGPPWLGAHSSRHRPIDQPAPTAEAESMVVRMYGAE